MIQLDFNMTEAAQDYRGIQENFHAPYTIFMQTPEVAQQMW